MRGRNSVPSSPGHRLGSGCVEKLQLLPTLCTIFTTSVGMSGRRIATAPYRPPTAVLLPAGRWRQMAGALRMRPPFSSAGGQEEQQEDPGTQVMSGGKRSLLKKKLQPLCLQPVQEECREAERRRTDSGRYRNIFGGPGKHSGDVNPLLLFPGPLCFSQGRQKRRGADSGRYRIFLGEFMDSGNYPPPRSPSSCSTVSELSIQDSGSLAAASSSDTHSHISPSPKRKKKPLPPGTTIDRFVIRTSRLEKELIDEKIAQFIYATNSSFRLIENPHFINMVQSLRPGYSPPTRADVAGKLLDQVYDREMEQCATALEGKIVNLSIDGWSNVHNDPIVCACITKEEDKILCKHYSYLLYPHPLSFIVFFFLLLPGSTPLGCYKKLIEYHKRGDLSFKYVKTFNMDEYVGLPRDHPESYHSYMWNNFFKHTDIDPNNAYILDGNAADLQAECEEFERKIKEAGGIELFVGGIGPDGHIAFNEPGSSLVSRTRLKTLATDTILANAKYFDGNLSKVPTMALTVGVGTVMDAREVLILITGAHKAFALYKAIEEGVNHMWTVSAFQQHPRTIFVCDEDATLELRVKTVKYFKGLMHVHNKLVEPLHSMKKN
ncbi:unnamed protein product [Ranitomeya imitator]|uniref:Glucosamine-6-phosphate deaminase 2 n=2 Tax=Ranitomeya imitator TaxID=111125 RepID=A0ABN9LH56_9NEOB|nr:unnamed protein product [Ranitomeya imitator]